MVDGVRASQPPMEIYDCTRQRVGWCKDDEKKSHKQISNQKNAQLVLQSLKKLVYSHLRIAMSFVQQLHEFRADDGTVGIVVGRL